MKIIFKKSAEKEILSLERKTSRKIFSKISLLSESPFPPGSQKLEGGTGYRIRIGNYRVIYTINKLKKVILITKIAHRKEVYK
jgi:mRNA interferase RelE/StbE